MPPLSLTPAYNSDFHQLDVSVMDRELYSFPFDNTTIGQVILDLMELKGIDNYVALVDNSPKTNMIPIYVSSPVTEILNLIKDNDQFPTTPLSNKLQPNRNVSTRKQRFSIYIVSIPDYQNLLEIQSLNLTTKSILKRAKRHKINILLPNHSVIKYNLDPSRTFKEINDNIFQKLCKIYGSNNIAKPDHFVLRIADSKFEYKSNEETFQECPEMVAALEKQVRNPEFIIFSLYMTCNPNNFLETIVNDAKELDLSLPQLSLETQSLYASMSKNRHIVESERNNKISNNPLLARMRISQTDPPLYTCTKTNVAIKCELRAGITEATVTGTSILVSYLVSADQAIQQLISRIENHSKINIGKDASEFVLLVTGTDEVIAGEYNLVEFMSVRQFLVSNQPVMNVTLALKSQIIDSIKNKELAATPMEEPDESDFVPSITATSQGSLCISNLKLTTPMSIMIRSFKHFPAGVKNVGVTVAIINGTQTICDPVTLPVQKGGSKHILINQSVSFPATPRVLPRSARLSISVFDYDQRKKYLKKPKKKKHNGNIASMNFPLFTHDGWLNQGKMKRKMWPKHYLDFFLTTSQSNESGSVVCNFDLPIYRFPVFHQVPEVRPPSNRVSLHLKIEEIKRLGQLENLDVLQTLSAEDKTLIWNNRAKFLNDTQMLPLVLQSLDYTSPLQVAEIPYILKEWAPISSTEALSLLDPKFADLDVRKYAVSRLENLNDNELMLYMLQLVQALKFELYDDSPLAHFLLRRGLAEPKFLGHQLFWQLISEAHISQIRQRFSAVLVNFIYGIGSYRKELKTGYRFTQKLVELNTDLCKLSHIEATEQFKIRLKDVEIPDEFHLPMDPRLVVDSFILEDCKVMNSKKKPFWLTFHNAAPFSTEPVKTMFKVGDDLRQDQLTLQIMKVMEHLWRQNQVDLRMNCYGVLPTGFNQGFIEVVPNSITEQVLQQEGGRWTGVFKTNTMKDFLEKNNSSQINLNIAKENFLLSSAGYAVSSCVIGLADRHPGNIMVQRDGHFFHIDFGHFLGNFKKKLGYQREDAPFHFSPACAEALGGVGSEQYKRFEETCANAYNILRNNANLLMSMMLLMLGTGIPELQKPEDITYMKNMLNLSLSNEDAAAIFRKYIQMSLDSTKTTVNNWIHNLVVG